MSEPAAAAPASRRARQTVRDMLLSLGVILAIVAVVFLFHQRGGGPITVIDPSGAYAGARNTAAYQVRTPHGLPRGWRPTSARTEHQETGRVTLRVGFVTPKGAYAQLVESDLPRDMLFARELSAGARPTGTVELAGAQWQRLPAPQAGDRAIARSEGSVTYLLSGSAGLDELSELAASLR